MPDEVHLQDVIPDDLPIFYEHQLEPVATQMAAFPAREREPFMKHWAKIMGDKSINKQTILFNGQVAGNIVSWEQSGEREVGYWIGKEYWGKGIGTRALSEFLLLVSTRPLIAHVAKLNIGSFRVLEKNGFTISSQDAEEYIMKLD
jgi:RimJ/RimL family protein N-acetyltransferase